MVGTSARDGDARGVEHDGRGGHSRRRESIRRRRRARASRAQQGLVARRQPRRKLSVARSSVYRQAGDAAVKRFRAENQEGRGAQDRRQENGPPEGRFSQEGPLPAPKPPCRRRGRRSSVQSRRTGWRGHARRRTENESRPIAGRHNDQSGAGDGAPRAAAYAPKALRRALAVAFGGGGTATGSPGARLLRAGVEVGGPAGEAPRSCELSAPQARPPERGDGVPTSDGDRGPRRASSARWVERGSGRGEGPGDTSSERPRRPALGHRISRAKEYARRGRPSALLPKKRFLLRSSESTTTASPGESHARARSVARRRRPGSALPHEARVVATLVERRAARRSGPRNASVQADGGLMPSVGKSGASRSQPARNRVARLSALTVPASSRSPTPTCAAPRAASGPVSYRHQKASPRARPRTSCSRSASKPLRVSPASRCSLRESLVVHRFSGRGQAYPDYRHFSADLPHFFNWQKVSAG